MELCRMVKLNRSYEKDRATKLSMRLNNGDKMSA